MNTQKVVLKKICEEVLVVSQNKQVKKIMNKVPVNASGIGKELNGDQ